MTLTENIKKLLITLWLGSLMISAFFIFINNFKDSSLRSIDEMVYYRMAQQIVDQGSSGYTTAPYGKELAATGRPLDDYFFAPLFKHPPVFTFLAALSMKLFGTQFISAEYVALIMGILMIPLTYLLGTIMYGRVVGILASIFLWMDPIFILTSQKVWMDTTVSLFMLLAIYLFVLAIKNNRPYLFIWAGISIGLAVNTKYPGILILGIFLIYILSYQRNLLFIKEIYLMMAIPFLMLIPWIIWNIQIYGPNFLMVQARIHSGFTGLAYHFINYSVLWSLILIIILTTVFKNNPKKFSIIPKVNTFLNNKKYIQLFSIGFILLFIFLIKDAIVHSFSPMYIPTNSWAQGIFSYEPRTFYFNRLIEYSPLYLLGLLYILFYQPNQDSLNSVLRISTIVIIVFFTIWTAYQSRYILPVVPLIIISSCQGLVSLTKKIINIKIYWLKINLIILLFIFIVFVLMRTNYLNYAFSYTNNACYF